MGAIDLVPGAWFQVFAVEADVRSAQVHNLTVAGLHTYHVEQGASISSTTTAINPSIGHRRGVPTANVFWWMVVEI